jgi:hypothetical protein
VVAPSDELATNWLAFRKRMLFVVTTPIGAGAGAGVQKLPTQVCLGP